MFLLLSLVAVIPPPPELAIRSVAYIRADPAGIGTGFVVAGQPPRLVTCRHVVGGRKTAEVFFPRFGPSWADRADVLANRDALRASEHLVVGKVVAVSDELDLAVLELPSVPAGVNGLSLAATVPPPGTAIWAVGCRGDQETLWNVSRGVVRQRGPLRDGYYWQGKKLAVDAPGIALQLPVAEGDSGGPILNAAGEVVAVMSAVRRRVPGTSIGPDATAIRTILKLPTPKPGAAASDPLTRATVWVSPTATDRRTAGVVVDVRRKWVLTSNAAVGRLDRVGVAFPIFDRGHPVGDRGAYQDPVTLHLSGHWAIGTVIARDADRDLAVIELDRLPETATALSFARSEPKLGASVRAVSHPVGLEFVFAHSTGSVRQQGQLKLSRDGGNVPATVFQLPAQARAAGGPIVSEVGELLGILSAADAPAGIGYSASVNDARAFVAAIPIVKLTRTLRKLVEEYGSVPKLLALVTTNADMALSLNTECVPARLRRAETRLKAGRLSDAIADLDRITERHPQHAAALRLRAGVWLEKAKPKSAQADVQRILGFDSADENARLLSARAYAAVGDEPKAAAAFVAVIRLSPDRLPDVLTAIGRHADALTAKGVGSPGEWLALALNAVAKVLPKSELARALTAAPNEPTARAKYLRALCGDRK